MCTGPYEVIFFSRIKSLSISLNFWDQFIKSQSQSQNLIPVLKVSVSVSKIETGYTKSQSQSQHAKTGLAHPCNSIFAYAEVRPYPSAPPNKIVFVTLVCLYHIIAKLYHIIAKLSSNWQSWLTLWFSFLGSVWNLKRKECNMVSSRDHSNTSLWIKIVLVITMYSCLV